MGKSQESWEILKGQVSSEKINLASLARDTQDSILKHTAILMMVDLNQRVPMDLQGEMWSILGKSLPSAS